jgi:hypothetical protein
MRKPIGLAALTLVVALTSNAIDAQKPIPVQVFKEATCGCCSVWVEHLRRNGFAATSENVADMQTVKDIYKVPAQTRSCHTALVGGYVIEGHVPAAEIHRLLKEKPKVAGLAVPGMPIGSPGMEGPNGRPYDVLTFEKTGKIAVFSTQRPSGAH